MYPICLRARKLAELDLKFKFPSSRNKFSTFFSHRWRFFWIFFRFLCHWNSCRKELKDSKIQSSSHELEDLKNWYVQSWTTQELIKFQRIGRSLHWLIFVLFCVLCVQWSIKPNGLSLSGFEELRVALHNSNTLFLRISHTHLQNGVLLLMSTKCVLCTKPPLFIYVHYLFVYQFTFV